MKKEDYIKMKKQTKINFLTIILLLISVVFAGIIIINAETEQPKTTHAFTENIKLGGVFPIERRPDAGPDRRDAFYMAVAELNEQTGPDRILPDGINFTALVEDDNNTAVGGALAASTLIAEGVDVVIGSSGSSVSAAMAAVLGPEKIVQLSYASSSPTLSNRGLYPYFMRNVPSDADQGIALADLVDAFNWTKGATICTSDSYGTGLIEVFTNVFEDRDGTITTAQQFDPLATDVSVQVAAIKASNPEFVIANMIDVDGAVLFDEAGNALLTNGTADAISWIITDGTSVTSTFEGNQAVEDAMQNFIGTSPVAMRTAEYDAFNTSWFDPKWLDTKYWGGLAGPARSQSGGSGFNAYSPYAYDAVYVVAKGLRDAGTAEGDALLEKMYKVTHKGASGEIKFNVRGELNGHYKYVHLSGTTYTSFGEWNGTGYGLNPATFTLPDATTFIPIKLTFPPFYIAPEETTHTFTGNIKLGGVFPIVKRPDAGRDRRDAYLMAVAELNEQPADGNEAGGPRILPDGINFTVLVKDDDNTAAGGTFAALTLIAEGVDVVIGSSGSSVSAAMAAVLGPEKIVQLSYASSSPTLSNRGSYPYFMRNVPSDADQGIALADLVDTFNWTKGATICTSDSYGTGLITVFTNIFRERGGTITTAQQFDPLAIDVSTQVAAIKASNPEFVIANMVDVDGATLFKEAADQLLTDGGADAVPWIITGGTAVTSTFSGSVAVEDAMQKFIGTTPVAMKTAEYDAFNASWFNPKWLDPKYWGGLAGPANSQATGLAFNSYAPFAYDAVYVVAKALRDAGTAAGDALLDAMYDVTHTGASGEIKFNPLGELAGRFDYVHLSGTTYTSFGVWNGTGGYGLDPATFTLPDTKTFVPTKLTFPPYSPYDTTPPTVNIDSPSSTTYGTDMIMVTLSGDADHYWYSIAGVDTVNKTWTPFMTCTLTDGTYTLHAYGNDSVGNIGYSSVIFTIEIPTDLEIQLEYLVNGTTHPPGTDILFTVDMSSKEVRYNWDGAANITLVYGGSVSMYVVYLPTGYGSHVLHIYAMDWQNNWSHKKYVFITGDIVTTTAICENNPPEVTITGIEDDETYLESVTIDVTVTDASPITRATINIDGGDIDETEDIDLDLAAGTWTGSYELDTTDFPDDTYRITIKIYDACGNVKTIRLDVTFENGNTSGTEGTPDISPGFESISVFLSLVAIAAVIWRRRRR